MKSRNVIVSSSLVLSMVACAHESKTVTETPIPLASQPAVPSARASAGLPAVGAAHACASDADCSDKQLCIRSQCVDITPELAECSMARVHFDLNDANLHPDETAKLVRMARCLKADHDLDVMIAGNADERGTEEWNIALGDRRATSVSTYLESLGVSQAQLKTVSYGKERPLCDQHNEECWAKNRRASLRPK